MLWNLLSPIWEKIISILCDKVQPLVVNKYNNISCAYKNTIKIIFLILAAAAIIFACYFCKKNSVSIVRLDITNTESTTACLDFTIRNDNTYSDRLIEQATVYVKDYYVMSSPSNLSLISLEDDDVPLARLDSTYTYEMILNSGKNSEKQVMAMSQVAPAGGFDNFSMKIVSDEDKPLIVRIGCEFLFDNGEKIKSDDCVLVLGCTLLNEEIDISEQIPSYELEFDNIYENYNALKRFEEYKCKYASDYFFDILNSYENVMVKPTITTTTTE